MCMQYKVYTMSKTRTFLVWTKGDHPLSLNIIVLTDSEQVPWGKGEKHHKSYKNLKLFFDKTLFITEKMQNVQYKKSDSVPFV